MGVAVPAAAGSAQSRNPGETWRTRDYKVFLIGAAASTVGNGVTFTVLPLLVVELSRSGSRLGVLGLLQSLPSLAVGLLAGSLADRYDRRRLMIFCDVGRGLLIAAVPLAWYAGAALLPVIYATVVPVAALTPVFLAAYSAAVPCLAGRAHVPAATSELQAVIAVGYVAGPGLTAALVAFSGLPAALWVDVASFAVSAACLATVRGPLQSRSEAAEAASTGVLGGITEGLAFVRQVPAIRALLRFWLVASGSTVLLIPAVVYMVGLQRALPSWSFPSAVVMFSLGAFGGFAVAPRLSRVSAGPPMLLASLVTGLAVLSVAHVAGLAALLAGALLAGAGSGCVTSLYVAVRTALTPDRLLGRVGSLSELVTDAVSPIALMSEGLLLGAFGATLVLTAIGIMFVIAGLCYVLAPALHGVRAAADTSLDQPARIPPGEVA